MNNFIVYNNVFYNTGFKTKYETPIRIKQNLDPQDITSACAYSKPYLTSYPTKCVPEGSVCYQNTLYPAKQVQLSYGIPKIPNYCPCTDYIKAP